MMIDKKVLLDFLNKKIDFYEELNEKDSSDFYNGKITGYKDVLLSVKLGDFAK